MVDGAKPVFFECRETDSVRYVRPKHHTRMRVELIASPGAISPQRLVSELLRLL